ncbi:hypothetical protein PKHYL_04640 [Psychrobacter sp. KH172YL61]|uniref:cytochrome c5 family protein n=1 Tax=Psychrobacter sp. KH172YL61 TaxID=2517899 RepID=UPI0010B0FFC0|nr:cytochrome c5 family protein [Psychrobacter sp. KH172YL61]BBI66273.1 hypothetical protein PKHYL_04640 [Psychrobacter sp. KH172YL61]
MFSINRLLSKGYHALTVGSAALLLSGIMISSAGAADIATTYDNSCAACHDSGALNAIKKAIVPNGRNLLSKRACRHSLNLSKVA